KEKANDLILEKLVFDTLVVQEEWGDCAKSEENCITIHLEYPRIQNSDSIMGRINTHITRFLIGAYRDSFENPGNYASYLKEEYQRQAQNNPSFPGWQIEKLLSVASSANEILSLRLESFENLGGAHPENKILFQNYWLRSGKRIALSELFKTGFEDSLIHLAQYHLRQALQVDLEMGVDGTPTSYDVNAFRLGENFLLDENGISFLFERESLTATGGSQVEFTIPFSELIEYNLINEKGPLGFLLGSVNS